MDQTETKTVYYFWGGPWCGQIVLACTVPASDLKCYVPVEEHPEGRYWFCHSCKRYEWRCDLDD